MSFLRYSMLNNVVNLQSRSEVTQSLKVVPFDRLGMVSYYCSIVTLSVRHTVFFRYSTYIRDLETRVRGHSRSLKPTRIDPPPMTSY